MMLEQKILFSKKGITSSFLFFKKYHVNDNDRSDTKYFTPIGFLIGHNGIIIAAIFKNLFLMNWWKKNQYIMEYKKTNYKQALFMDELKKCKYENFLIY